MKRNRLFTTLAAAGLAAAGFFVTALAQSPPGDPAHTAHTQHPSTPQDTKALVDQIAELRAKVARLEAALGQGHAPQSGAAAMPSQPMQVGPGMQRQMGTPGMQMSGMPQQGASGGGMPGMGGSSGMGMMDDMMNMMSGMGGGGMAGGSGRGMGMMNDMPMMDQMMMMGMSRMGGGMQGGSMTSALPGFPGASHIYHVGATGLFLDHPQHITLTVEQQQSLNQLKEATLLEQATLERKIEQADQELWALTAADEPDAAKVEAKIREVEKLRGDQRIAFIRGVGSAAQLLTDEQRKQLTGHLPPVSAPATAPAAGAGMGGMSDM